MVRISDARMSGTAYGTVVLHVCPEAAVGRQSRAGRDGDFIELDVEARRLHLDVSTKNWTAGANLGRRRCLPPTVDISGFSRTRDASRHRR